MHNCEDCVRHVDIHILLVKNFVSYYFVHTLHREVVVGIHSAVHMGLSSVCGRDSSPRLYYFLRLLERLRTQSILDLKVDVLFNQFKHICTHRSTESVLLSVSHQYLSVIEHTVQGSVQV